MTIYDIVFVILCGVPFGIALVEADMINARKIAGVFYLLDLSVPVVMFSAIGFGMLYLWGSFAMGWIELQEIRFIVTRPIPQAIGGFMVGLGMVVGGYCPGTAIAAAATGKKDAVLAILGMSTGILIYGNYFAPHNPFDKSYTVNGPMGPYWVHDLLGISIGEAILILLVFPFIMVGILRVLKRYFYKERSLGRLGWKNPIGYVLAASVLIGVGCTQLPDRMYMQEPPPPPPYVYQYKAVKPGRLAPPVEPEKYRLK